MNPAQRTSLAVFWLLSLLSVAASAASAPPFFKPFAATFSVSRGALPLGTLELRFTLEEAAEYSYHAHTRPGFLAGWFSGNEVIEESRGRLSADRVSPVEYRYRETTDVSDNVDVRFDWNEEKAYTTSGGVTWAQAIEPGTQDRLSQQLMIRLGLAGGRQEVTYRVADGGKLKHYRFKVVGEEPIKTPLGRLHCLKVERRKESRPPDYTIWFATELDYLPVRIERKQRSGHYKMELKRLEGL